MTDTDRTLLEKAARVLRFYAPTLRGQVRRFCINCFRWPTGAADDCADLAVEIVGSNWPIFNKHDMSCVLAEVCCAPGEQHDQ